MKKILIVEDNPDMHIIYSDILSEKHTVEIAPNTKVAEEKLRGGTYDLMILDVILPDERGDEFFERLRKMPEYANLPVVCVTVLDDVKRRMRKIDPGIRFLPKPFTREGLLETTG